MTYGLVFILADATLPDNLSGGAGWIGAGLLGAVLSWLLLKHLPAKDAQLEKLIGGHTAAIDSISKTHAETIRIMQSECREERHSQADKFQVMLYKTQETLVQALSKFQEEEDRMLHQYQKDQESTRQVFTTLCLAVEKIGKANDNG